MEKIKVIIKKPGIASEVQEINNSLETLQQIVCGNIEIVRFPQNSNVVIICNEEGKISDLANNFTIHGDVIVGPAIIAGDDGEGELISLTDFQCSHAVGYCDFNDTEKKWQQQTLEQKKDELIKQ